MLCCVCKDKPATLHLTWINHDQVQKLDFCEDCAEAKGVDAKDPACMNMTALMAEAASLQKSRQRDWL